MKKIIAFVGETFDINNGVAYASQTSVAFLQDCIGRENVYVCSPMQEVMQLRGGYSTRASMRLFYPVPNYRSTKEFLLKALFRPSFIRQFYEVADNVIAKHSGELFWIRTPSIGSIFFGLRALAAGQTVLHHMCADASNTWRDAKYSTFEKGFGFLVSRFLRYKLRQICKHPNTINLCTGNVLEEFSKQVAPNHTYQFVDVMVKPPTQQPIMTYQANQLRILFVGRVVADKGVFDLLDVAKRLDQRFNFTIAGGGPELEQAKAYCEKLRLTDRVLFTGQLPHSQLAQLYDKHDVVVVPSNNFYEGFPRVIMEAWSHHKPVVVANVGGINAFVKHEINGFIFAPGDQEQLYSSLLRLVDDATLYNKLHAGAVLMAAKSLQEFWLADIKRILKLHGVVNEA
ncbi:glycosyltransferase family 4 protein [Aeromonas veronii]|uniref:glycosyltransferase family 4 protein n=1 Tax=Aeromonas veronii TaxID=654 RepID=UPI003BA0E9EC